METFVFSAHIQKVDNLYLSHILVVPQHIIESIGKKGRIRTKGTINGHPFALAIQHLKTGERYFSISSPLKRAAKIQLSVPVEVTFSIVDENELDIPEELTAVLEQDPEGRLVFENFTIGYKRGLIHYITSVKNIDSRIKRAIEIVNKAKSGQLYSQKNKN